MFRGSRHARASRRSLYRSTDRLNSAIAAIAVLMFDWLWRVRRHVWGRCRSRRKARCGVWESHGGSCPGGYGSTPRVTSRCTRASGSAFKRRRLNIVDIVVVSRVRRLLCARARSTTIRLYSSPNSALVRRIDLDRDADARIATLHPRCSP